MWKNYIQNKIKISGDDKIMKRIKFQENRLELKILVKATIWEVENTLQLEY